MLTLTPHSAFEIDNILINAGHPEAAQRLAQRPSPDLSASTAIATFCSYMPGCLASLILALAFGTTKNMRDRLRSALRSSRRTDPHHIHYHRRRRRGASGSSSSSLTSAGGRPFRYVAMDSDNGILSRKKRLSMEKQLRIEVTYEFEIRAEQVEVPPVLQLRGENTASKKKVGGGSAFPYSVEEHQWDDTERILPKKPSISVMRGQG